MAIHFSSFQNCEDSADFRSYGLSQSLLDPRGSGPEKHFLLVKVNHCFWLRLSSVPVVWTGAVECSEVDEIPAAV